MSVLFVCALPEESNNETTLLGFPIIHTGVGKINAGYKTALAIQKYKPELVVNFGSCGSFEIEKGTLVKVKDVYNGDMDAEPIVPYSVTPFDNNGGNLHISASGVSCFTSETFINKEKLSWFSSKKLELLQKCHIFEMELYSIVKVCKEFDVPVVAYKWVSDDGEVSDWKENTKIGYKKFQEEFLTNSYKNG
jgi:adenosylhomocysteine nucleosidase